MLNFIPKKSFFGASIGTMVEYYDYVLFSMLLPILAPLFFPAATAYQSLSKSYVIMFITMFSRPLGGIFFGYLGDTLGRRKALLMSLYGIALATAAIGLTPSYLTIGAWAVVLITIAKTIQTFCFAGEYNGAGIYVIEHAQNNKDAFVGSLLSTTTIFGSLIASFIGYIVTFSFMPVWSWRLAFIFGALIGVFGILYRKNLTESPDFKQADSRQQSFMSMLKLYPREIVACIFIGGFITVPYVTVLGFISPVLTTKGFYNNHQFMLLQTVLNIIGIIAIPIAGLIADKTSTKIVMKFACWALVLISYPLLCLVDTFHLPNLVFALIMIVIINEIMLGPSYAYLNKLFIMQYRYRAISFGFCIGMSMFSGLTPIIENYLYQLTGKFSAVSLWLIFIGLGTYLSMLAAEKKSPVTKPSTFFDPLYNKNE